MTTGYEVEAGSDLCEMIGLNRDDSMGHLVTGGSIANIEAIWVARNLKYYPLGLQEALLNDDQLAKASGYQVRIYIEIETKTDTVGKISFQTLFFCLCPTSGTKIYLCLITSQSVLWLPHLQ